MTIDASWRHVSYVLARVLIVVLLSTSTTPQRRQTSSSSVDFDVEFFLLEELPPRSFVGCVADFDFAQLHQSPADLSAVAAAGTRSPSANDVLDATDIAAGLTDRSRRRFRFLKTGSGTAAETGNDAMFSIDELSGDIRTTRRIDRDVMCRRAATCLVRLDVVVTGRRRRSPTAAAPARRVDIVRVGVNVVDDNDNPPVFPAALVSRSLTESTAAGTAASFTVPAADDPDGPPYGLVSYDVRCRVPPGAGSRDTGGDDRSCSDVFNASSIQPIVGGHCDNQQQQQQKVVLGGYNMADNHHEPRPRCLLRITPNKPLDRETCDRFNYCYNCLFLESQTLSKCLHFKLQENALNEYKDKRVYNSL